MTIILSNNGRAEALFGQILAPAKIPANEYSLIVVQHVLPNTLPFFQALKKVFSIAALIPKVSSIHAPTLAALEAGRFNVDHYSRDQLKLAATATKLKARIGEKKAIILDVGGYFSESMVRFQGLLDGRLVGVVEDTENGQQKYETALRSGGGFPCPVLSVARSPLKEPEDHLVGQAIVYSTERILRENNALLTNKRVLVIGYGKIGKSIASSLAVRNISVWVYDRDPIRRAQALSHGFLTPERDEAIARADLIFGATGNKSLSEPDFMRLKKYCFVTSVTSADDEFDFGNIRQALSNHFSEGLEVFHNEDKVFYLMNKGNAVNFLHNAVLGPYIYLVACELLACVIKLINHPDKLARDRIEILSEAERATIASKWQAAFSSED